MRMERLESITPQIQIGRLSHWSEQLKTQYWMESNFIQMVADFSPEKYIFLYCFWNIAIVSS